MRRARLQRAAGAAQRRPTITFLSDYGCADEFAGVCRGVIARRCPQARVIDITHGIAPQDVRAGALALAAAVPFMPPAVHLAVVDPGVGHSGPGARRALALRTGAKDHMLVGPDNGLLMLAAERLGGVQEAVDLERSPARAPSASRTFDGRDLFAPVAAALAAGEPLLSLGSAIAAHSLRRLQLPRAHLHGASLLAHVLHADRFGNLALDATPSQLQAIGATLGQALRLRQGAREHSARRVRAFADVGEGQLLVYEDAQGMVAVAVNRGSAARLLGAGRDDELVLEAR